MTLKIVIADTKAGKSLQKEFEGDTPKFLVGMKIGDTFKGESIDMPGYEFEITGGSDSSGFPMRKDINSDTRGKILAVSGIGLKAKNKGQRSRKTVAGKIINTTTAQLNVKTLKYGKTPLFEEPKQEEAAEQKEEAKTE